MGQNPYHIVHSWKIWQHCVHNWSSNSFLLLQMKRCPPWQRWSSFCITCFCANWNSRASYHMPWNFPYCHDVVNVVNVVDVVCVCRIMPWKKWCRECVAIEAVVYGPTVIQNSVLDRGYYSHSLDGQKLLPKSMKCLLSKEFFSMKEVTNYPLKLQILC